MWRAFNKFEALSPAHRHHEKTYATDLVASRRIPANRCNNLYAFP
jgi:hypothetical protein